MKIIKILPMAVFMLISGMLIAQTGDTGREKFQFGLKGGINISNVWDSETEEFTSGRKLGYVGGAVIRIPIGRFLGVQPEVLFSQKGFKGDGSILGSEYSFTRTTSYIDVPLQISIKPASFFTLVAGPQYSFLLKQKDVFDNSIISYEQEQEFKNDNIRKNTLGVVGGIDINMGHVVLGARVGWDILHNRGDGTSSTPRYKNTWVQATLGIAFY
jgi:hypothetical protein